VRSVPFSFEETAVRGVAQPGRALRLGRRGPQFESAHPDHLFRFSLALGEGVRVLAASLGRQDGRSTAPPWTVLFSIVSAVVTDSGGVLSHSAIVAREYGIPCVVGTGDATKRIPDGALVTVDGDSGTVAIDTQ
jgi:hypothetical protein